MGKGEKPAPYFFSYIKCRFGGVFIHGKQALCRHRRPRSGDTQRIGTA
jgi:hypothetical protein